MSLHRAASFRPALFFCWLAPFLLGIAPTRAQTSLPVDQIVERMRQHEANQSKELKHYEALRHYQVQYKGFGTHLAAQMDVNLVYDSDTGKTFRIVSQSGSKLLCDKVLKRAVLSEEEASKDKASTALDKTNYRFELAGTEVVNGRPAWILQVDPLKKSKFLYRGRIWIDSGDYAVSKIEVEPAKNPSFWITSTQIENTNSKVDGVWLPEKNRSESKIRVGGTAVLTIDYGTYQVTLAGLSRIQREWFACKTANLGKQLSNREHRRAARGTADPTTQADRLFIGFQCRAECLRGQ